MSEWVRRYGCELESHDRTWRIALKGEVDDVAVPCIEAAMRLIEPVSDTIVLDLRAVSFMDTSAARLLVRATDRARELGHALVLSRPSAVALETLELSGLQAGPSAPGAGDDMRRYALVATDIQGRVTDFNRAAEDLYGWLAWEAIGREITTVAICPQDEEIAAEINRSMQRSEVWDGEFDVVHRNGSMLGTRVREGMIRDLEGRPIGLMRLASPAVEAVGSPAS